MSYRMPSTNIEWVGPPGYSARSWNPLGWGCTGGCPWCYARAIGKRFGDKICDQYPTPEQVQRFGLDPEHSMCWNFFPHYHSERLEAPLHTRKPCGIFVQSMGDLWDPHVEPEWRHAIWKIVKQCPEHIFWVLTKQPHNIRAGELLGLDNLWVGVSVTRRKESWRADQLFHLKSGMIGLASDRIFVSYEPLLNHVIADIRMGWIIIGAQTGPAPSVPTTSQVRDIVERAEIFNVPMFIKDNLAAVMGEEYVKAHQEWPRAVMQ